MSKRNVVWLAIIVVVGVAVAFTVGVWWWGLVAAVIVLAISEVVERIMRQRRRRAKAGP